MTRYRRLKTQSLGAGAAEILSAILGSMQSEDSAGVVGSVHRVFDRSLYIEFTSEYTQAVPTPGPRLVVIGNPTFSGPLSLRVETDSPGGFRPGRVDPGAHCTLRTSQLERSDESPQVLAIGNGLEIEFQSKLLNARSSQSQQTVELDAISPESNIWRNAAEVVADLRAATVTDGLGWLNELKYGTGAGRPPEAFEGVVKNCRAAVERGWTHHAPAATRQLLGRGPGATPSGDDILAGIFLMLERTTSGAAQQRVRDAGETLVAEATERTTSISTALLAQAIYGRAADPILDAREALVTPEIAVSARRSAVSNCQRIGHTSGVDSLVGMLLTLLYIAPCTATCE